VLRVRGPEALGVAGVPVVGVAEAPQLARVPLQRLSERPVQLAQAVRQRQMRSSERLQVPGVSVMPVRRIACQLLQELHAVAEGGVRLQRLSVPVMGESQPPAEILLAMLEALNLHPQGLELAQEGGVLLTDEPELALVELDLFLVQ